MSPAAKSQGREVRPVTRSATTVWNTKSLVQVQVRNIRAKFAWCSATDQCIQIGAIEVHLAAMLMGNVAYLGDLLLKYTMS